MWFLILTYNTWPIIVLLRINPLDFDLLSSGGKEKFSTWACAAKSCQLNTVYSYEELSWRDLAFESTVVATLCHSRVFWKVSNFSLRCCVEFPRTPTLNSLGLIHPRMRFGIVILSHFSFLQQGLLVLKEEWSVIRWTSSWHQSATAL